jgi:hypothetical protein
VAACCVHFNTNSIYTAHNNIIQGFLELLLINIMLILPYSYRFWIDLDELASDPKTTAD